MSKVKKKTPFKDDRPSRYWYENFRRRHPELSIRKPQKLSMTRAAVTQEDLQDWFANNKIYLEKKDLLSILPSRIFNCEESSISCVLMLRVCWQQRGLVRFTKLLTVESWRKCVPKWKNEQSETSVTKENFPLVLQYTLDNMPNAENVVQSGFRGSGLYPFDSKAVDYNVLNKGKKSKQKFENNDIFKANEVTEEQRFLHEFEKNLQEELLLDFYAAASSGSWTGDVEKKALFDYWLQIYKNSTGETPRKKPIILSNEVLHDPKILDILKYRSRSSQENNVEDVDPGINPLINNRATYNEEYETNFKAESCNTRWQSVIIFDNQTSMNSDENGVGAINDTYDIVCDLPVQIIDQESLVSTNPMPDTLSKHSPIAANSGVASDNNLLLQNQSDPIDVQSLLIDKCSYNQDYQQGLENNQENICKSIDRQSSSVKKNSPKADKKVLDNSPKKPFKEIFTLPVEYLPKKKV
ncbi:uncharacterized protein LOC141525801 isoform X1 [Cotesia typhae]|uniref:uncharacterized protein LOC141525801 isoform X1 n=1 Tax=Cotesia typhae TaxID=2053667 RepID=UPI003D682C73